MSAPVTVHWAGSQVAEPAHQQHEWRAAPQHQVGSQVLLPESLEVGVAMSTPLRGHSATFVPDALLCTCQSASGHSSDQKTQVLNIWGERAFSSGKVIC